MSTNFTIKGLQTDVMMNMIRVTATSTINK
jgi:hypothetical protein